MPENSSAADEHALISEISAPLATLPDDAVQSVAETGFPIVLRGYDRMAVDTYVRRTSRLVAELQATHSPEAAVRRALERVGEEVSGILQRAHETAERITAQSRREAEERLERSRLEAAQTTAGAEQRVKDLDLETDRIWAERHRIVEDTRELARQLMVLSDSALERFPPAEDTEERAGEPDAPAVADTAGGVEDDADAVGDNAGAAPFDREAPIDVSSGEAGLPPASAEGGAEGAGESAFARPGPSESEGEPLPAAPQPPQPEVFTSPRTERPLPGATNAPRAEIEGDATGSPPAGTHHVEEQPTEAFVAVEPVDEQPTLHRPIWERGAGAGEQASGPGERTSGAEDRE